MWQPKKLAKLKHEERELRRVKRYLLIGSVVRDSVYRDELYVNMCVSVCMRKKLKKTRSFW